MGSRASQLSDHRRYSAAQEEAKGTDGGSAKDTANGSKDIVGILVRHERDDEIGEAETEETVGKHRLGRVEVRHSAPEEQERGESNAVEGGSADWLLALRWGREVRTCRP